MQYLNANDRKISYIPNKLLNMIDYPFNNFNGNLKKIDEISHKFH